MQNALPSDSGEDPVHPQSHASCASCQRAPPAHRGLVGTSSPHPGSSRPTVRIAWWSLRMRAVDAKALNAGLSPEARGNSPYTRGRRSMSQSVIVRSDGRRTVRHHGVPDLGAPRRDPCGATPEQPQEDVGELRAQHHVLRPVPREVGQSGHRGWAVYRSEQVTDGESTSLTGFLMKLDELSSSVPARH